MSEVPSLGPSHLTLPSLPNSVFQSLIFVPKPPPPPQTLSLSWGLPSPHLSYLGNSSWQSQRAGSLTAVSITVAARGQVWPLGYCSSPLGQRPLQGVTRGLLGQAVAGNPGEPGSLPSRTWQTLHKPRNWCTWSQVAVVSWGSMWCECCCSENPGSVSYESLTCNWVPGWKS